MKSSVLPIIMAAAIGQSPLPISNRYPDINFVPRNTKHNHRQRCTTYTPGSPEVKVMTKQFWQRAVQKGKANYYCICDSCGDSYQLGKEGEKCKECKAGKLYPQDVEPWGDE